MKIIVLDTTKTQAYIFGSNRLRENLGASFLVARATCDWVFATLPQPSNVADGKIIENLHIESDQRSLEAEVLYVGGGNAVILFQDGGQADRFLRDLSKKILIEAPGLQVAATSLDFDWQRQPAGLHQAVQDGMAKLAVQKHGIPVSEPLLGLGVTRACQSTGLPAVAFSPKFRDEPVFPVSREVRCKQEARDEANARLQAYLDPGETCVYPTELEDLGRSFGEFSYIGVVHIDGNAMGRRIRNVGQGLPNRDYIRAMRAFSEKLNESGLDALRATVRHLAASIDTRELAILEPGIPALSQRRSIDLRRSGDKIVLPFRPIIYGGDDVTFVCDGRLAVALALHYMAEFERITADLPDSEGTAHSCAGVAIVKSHYPFARACELASQLCSSAKTFLREAGVNASAIDWHFANAGLAGDLDEIRSREMKTASGWLNLRPVVVSDAHAGARSWATIQQGSEAFQGPDWRNKRNKVKSLRDALRSGPHAVRLFCEKYLVSSQQHLPDLHLHGSEYRQTGWLALQGETDWRCAYFDPIELADFQMPLTVAPGGVSTTSPQEALA